MDTPINQPSLTAYTPPAAVQVCHLGDPCHPKETIERINDMLQLLALTSTSSSTAWSLTAILTTG